MRFRELLPAPIHENLERNYFSDHTKLTFHPKFYLLRALRVPQLQQCLILVRFLRHIEARLRELVLLIQVHGADLLCMYRRRDVLLISFHLHQQLVQLRFLIVHEANLHYLRMERSKCHGCRASERQLNLDSRPLNFHIFIPASVSTSSNTGSHTAGG